MAKQNKITFDKFKKNVNKFTKTIDKFLKNKIVLLVTVGLLCLTSTFVVFNTGYLLGKSSSYMDFVSASNYTTYKSSAMNNSTPFQYYSEARFQSIHVDGNYMYTVDANTKTELIRATTTGSVIITKYNLSGREIKAYELNYADVGTKLYKGYKLDGFSARFGGFYFGEKYNYLVITGMDIGSDAPINSVIKKTKYAVAPAYRVVKYSKNFKAIDYLDIPYTDGGNNITRPLGFSTVSIAENSDGSEICISTGKEGIGDNNGAGGRHQQALQFIIDTKTMTLKGSIYQNFVSHSLNQFVIYDEDDNRLFVDVSDNQPHGIVANKVVGDKFATTRKVMHTTPNTSAYWLMYMNLGGIANGLENYLVAFTSMDNSTINNNTEIRDVMVSVLNKNMSTYTNVVLGDYTTEKTHTAGQPYLVPIDDDKFVVLWYEYTSGKVYQNTCYAVIDSKGTILQEKTIDNDLLLNRWCIPKYSEKDDCVVWYVDTVSNNISNRTFYKLEIEV